MITTIRTTVTINSSQVVHWGSEFGTMCGAGAGFGKKINDSQATTATCKRCVKLIALQVELAHAEALEQNMAVDAASRAVETADAITAHQIARAENMDRIVSEDWDAALVEQAQRDGLKDFDVQLAKGVEDVTTDQLVEGDIVLHYGMVIRVGTPQVFQGFSQRAVYHLPGQVQNMAEVFRPDHVTRGLLKADASWAIQGNSLARWTRVAR